VSKTRRKLSKDLPVLKSGVVAEPKRACTVSLIGLLIGIIEALMNNEGTVPSTYSTHMKVKCIS
jgi:hypothetical protein